MAKTLAELRQSPHVGLPQRHYPLCIAGKLVAQCEELGAELDELEAQIEKYGDKDGGAPRVGAKSPRVQAQAAYDAKLAEFEAAREEMNDHLADVLLQAKEGHDWRAFVAARPAREDQVLDQRLGANIDQIIADMPEFIVTVSGDPLEPGDWEFMRKNAADGDLRGMVGLLVDMHNRGVNVPKSRRSSQKIREQSNASD